MTMPIFLLGSFFGEVQDRSKDHLDRMSRTCILNLFHMCKVDLFYPTCIRDVSHTPTDAYILERLGVHFTHTFWRHSLLSLMVLWLGLLMVMQLGLLGAASWWSILDETSWGCVTHWVGWLYGDFAGWSILLTVVTPPFFISVFGLASIDLLVHSICILLSLCPRRLK